MSTIARLEVIPTREGNMSDAVASAVGALDGFDVSYETTPTDTVIEADDASEVFAAAEAAHRAVADERVITSLEVDEHRTRRQDRHERVASVEQKLGHPAKRERPGSGAGAGRGGERGAEPRQRGERGGETRQRETAETELQRYHGPVRTQSERRERRPTETQPTGTGSTETRPMGREAGPRTEAGATESGGTTSRYLQAGRPISR